MAGGILSANQTALPGTLQLPRRDRVRWQPHWPADRPGHDLQSTAANRVERRLAHAGVGARRSSCARCRRPCRPARGSGRCRAGRARSLACRPPLAAGTGPAPRCAARAGYWRRARSPSSRHRAAGRGDRQGWKLPHGRTGGPLPRTSYRSAGAGRSTRRRRYRHRSDGRHAPDDRQGLGDRGREQACGWTRSRRWCAGNARAQMARDALAGNAEPGPAWPMPLPRPCFRGRRCLARGVCAPAVIGRRWRPHAPPPSRVRLREPRLWALCEVSQWDLANVAPNGQSGQPDLVHAVSHRGWRAPAARHSCAPRPSAPDPRLPRQLEATAAPHRQAHSRARPAGRGACWQGRPWRPSWPGRIGPCGLHSDQSVMPRPCAARLQSALSGSGGTRRRSRNPGRHTPIRSMQFEQLDPRIGARGERIKHATHFGTAGVSHASLSI